MPLLEQFAKVMKKLEKYHARDLVATGTNQLSPSATGCHIDPADELGLSL
jgi:hypothetical protein